MLWSLKSLHSEIFYMDISMPIIIFHLNREERLESPRSHPDPSPAKDLLITEGLEGALSKSQFDTLLNCKGVQVRIYQESQSAA